MVFNAVLNWNDMPDPPAAAGPSTRPQ
jgi:hypothetical protein